MSHFRHRVFANQFNSDVHKVANDAIDFAANITDLGKFGGLDFDERCPGEFRKAARYLGLTDTGWPDHQNILGSNFAAQRLIYLHAAPAISKCDRDGPFGVVLTNDVLIQFLDDFSRSHL